jgi:hypothetical protein
MAVTFHAYISRINIETKVLEETWYYVGGGRLKDIAHNNSHGIFALFQGSGGVFVHRIGFDGIFVDSVEVDSKTEKIFSERWTNNIYTCDDVGIKIYSKDLALLSSIDLAGVLNVSVDNANIYILLSTSVKKYSLAGEYISEFTVEAGSTDLAC